MDTPRKKLAGSPAPRDERKYRAPALEKGLDIIELMARHSTPMTLTQISQALNRSVSELFRMIQALEFKGYIEASAVGDGYALTNRLFTLGMAQAPTKTLLEAALPIMRRLANSCVQSCHLVVASDDQMVVVARIEAPGDLTFSVRVGYRRPIVDATSGSVIFAFQPEEIRKTWFKHLSENVARKHMQMFLARAEEIRDRGFARTASEVVHGVVDISAPIQGAYRAVAALTVPFVKRMPPPHTIDEVVDLVREAAFEISTRIRSED